MVNRLFLFVLFAMVVLIASKSMVNVCAASDDESSSSDSSVASDIGSEGLRSKFKRRYKRLKKKFHPKPLSNALSKIGKKRMSSGKRDRILAACARLKLELNTHGGSGSEGDEQESKLAALMKAMEEIKNHLGSVAQGAQDTLDTAKEAIVSAAGQIPGAVEGAKEAIVSAAGQIPGAVEGAVGAIGSAAADIPDAALDVITLGEDVVKGFIEAAKEINWKEVGGDVLTNFGELIKALGEEEEDE